MEDYPQLVVEFQKSEDQHQLNSLTKFLFEKQGFIVTPYLVDFKTKRNSSITIIDFLPSAGNLELVETGSREIIGRFYYFIKDIY